MCQVSDMELSAMSDAELADLIRTHNATGEQILPQCLEEFDGEARAKAIARDRLLDFAEFEAEQNNACDLVRYSVEKEGGKTRVRADAYILAPHIVEEIERRLRRRS